ncbi:MAG: hypothetical protein ACEQSK_08665 [Sphingomonadaceae bacterium]
MNPTGSPQIDKHLLQRLVEQLSRCGGAQDLGQALATALELWLAVQTQLPAAADASSVRGYQWKTLFLPEGTVLRSWSYGEHNYAIVEGDQILHAGRPVSPNQFAQLFARSTRNAWADLYLRRPGDTRYKLACRLRDEMQRQNQQNQQNQRPAASPADASIPVTNGAIAALVAALQTCMVSAAQTAATTSVTCDLPARDSTPGPGWNLPERRKFRYRLEDIAF